MSTQKPRDHLNIPLKHSVYCIPRLNCHGSQIYNILANVLQDLCTEAILTKQIYGHALSHTAMINPPLSECFACLVSVHEICQCQV